MRSEYIEAVEARLAWIRWAKTPDASDEFKKSFRFGKVMHAYVEILETADTFFMSRQFAALVDHARQEIPDTITFDARWIQSKRGFLWIEEPFIVPDSEYHQVLESPQVQMPPMRIRAIGWREIPPGEWLVPQNGEPWRAPDGCYQFVCFMDMRHWQQLLRLQNPAYANSSLDPQSFSPWAYFVIRDGSVLIDRITEFETKGRMEDPRGAYIDRDSRTVDKYHEIRWIYTALYLMAQRLSIQITHNPDRATKRRAEKSGHPAPPILRVITLRRLEEARQRDPSGNSPDWRWQWEVRGHWRHQPTNEGYKDIFIEAYIKGPIDKPLKPSSHKIFSARR